AKSIKKRYQVAAFYAVTTRKRTNQRYLCETRVGFGCGSTRMRSFPFVAKRASLLLPLLVAGGALAVDGEGDAARPADSVAARHTERPSGRILVLPGVYNTRLQLAGFVKRAK